MNTLNGGAHKHPITEQVLGLYAFSWHAYVFALKQYFNKYSQLWKKAQNTCVNRLASPLEAQQLSSNTAAPQPHQKRTTIQP